MMFFHKRIDRASLATLGLGLAVFLLVDSTVAREGARKQGSEVSYSRSSSTSNSRDSNGDTQQRRLREGTIISDQKGHFREDGEGATFVADTGFEFGMLPNLNLERVVRLLKNAEQPTSIRWSVTGQVTEFTGKNFLLISRAVYKSANPPPAPDLVVTSPEAN